MPNPEITLEIAGHSIRIRGNRLLKHLCATMKNHVTPEEFSRDCGTLIGQMTIRIKPKQDKTNFIRED